MLKFFKSNFRRSNVSILMLSLIVFVAFGLSPFWIFIFVPFDNIAMQNLWLGPAIAFVFLTACKFMDVYEPPKKNFLDKNEKITKSG